MLKQLEALKTLCFSDMIWGQSPIVQLPNYRTVTLYDLPHLTMLDGVSLTPEMHSMATEEATKHMLYYSLKQRELREAFRNVREIAEEKKRVCHLRLFQNLLLLLCCLVAMRFAL